jgi:hypothetical protein
MGSAASGMERKAAMKEQQEWHDRTRYEVLLFVGDIVLFVLAGGWILDWY